ncbi:hypothetical protein EGJ34_17145 [Stenotrophomonas sp. 278]|nr:hypothetical protein EGJ34_17145 [Stenotrophomonas sp. 278]
MNPSPLPIEKTFATGSQGTTLVLMICAGWLWAGLYASPHSSSPVEVAASARLTAKAGRRTLTLGGHSFAVSNASLHAIRRWLDRNRVRVRVTPDAATRKAA